MQWSQRGALCEYAQSPRQWAPAPSYSGAWVVRVLRFLFEAFLATRPFACLFVWYSISRNMDSWKRQRESSTCYATLPDSTATGLVCSTSVLVSYPERPFIASRARCRNMRRERGSIFIRSSPILTYNSRSAPRQMECLL